MADEKLVIQVEEELAVRDTDVMAVPRRAATHCEWPPAPPLPAELEEAPVRRRARIYVAVRRPTTSS